MIQSILYSDIQQSYDGNNLTNYYEYKRLTYSLIYKDGKFADEEFARWASNHNRKWNDANFFISETAGALSNCCRLISDTTQLDPFINSIGGTALSIGSVKVSTMNFMPS